MARAVVRRAGPSNLVLNSYVDAAVEQTLRRTHWASDTAHQERSHFPSRYELLMSIHRDRAATRPSNVPVAALVRAEDARAQPPKRRPTADRDLPAVGSFGG
jgi:hypothetical protein